MNSLSILLFVITALSGLLAFYFWRSQNRFKIIASEYGRRLHQGKLYVEKMRNETKMNGDKLHNFNKLLAERDKKITAIHAELEIANKKLESTSNVSSSAVKTIENQNEHLQAQVKTMELQLRELDQAKSALENKFDKEVNQGLTKITSPFEKKISQLNKDQGELKKLVSSLEKQNAKYKRILKTVSPDHMRVLRKKLSQYSRLYVGLKGMKEMAEERSENLVSALTQTSTWILLKSGKKKDQISTKNLGALVAQAFDVIGGTYIPDELHTGDDKQGQDAGHLEENNHLARRKKASTLPRKKVNDSVK